MSKRPLVIAHRGASGYRPEHTRAAYLLAIELGADAIEPDLVATSDRVLVIRHENEISGTTDIAARPEFASRRTTKTVDGQQLTGWFTEDFTWAELQTLTAVERIPAIRPGNDEFRGPILRFTDLLEILDAAGRPVALVAEVKHPTYFASIGLPLDELFADELRAAGWVDDPRLTVECFEKSLLLKMRELGIGGTLVYLVDETGAPADDLSHPYSETLTDAGLAALAAEVDGVSPGHRLILPPGQPVTDLVARAHSAGLLVFTWTLRAEDEFLDDRYLGDWMSQFLVLMCTGVDGVFADQPDLALRARAEL